MISCYTELLSCAEKKMQQLKRKKKKEKQFWEILEIDKLEWLKHTGKLSKASSKLLMYFRPSDIKFCLEIVSS